MSPPTVSVLMPVYNAEAHVVAAVRSVLEQSFADFELLVIDDGSTDGTRRTLERLAERDQRIRLTSRENRGLVVTLNELIEMARGTFLARMDADDVCLPDRFERQLDFLHANPKVVCVGGGIRQIDGGGLHLATSEPTRGDAAIQEQLLSGSTAICHPSAMMRAEPVRTLGGYRAETWPVEDLDLWLRLGEVGTLENLALPPVLDYRVHAASISSRNQELQLELARRVCEEAWRRRGLAPRALALRRFRPEGRASESDYWLGFGWRAFMEGRRATALRLGLRSVARAPWRPGPWRLVACGLVKPAPAGGARP